MWRDSGNVTGSSCSRPGSRVAWNKFLYWLMHKGIRWKMSGSRRPALTTMKNLSVLRMRDVARADCELRLGVGSSSRMKNGLTLAGSGARYRRYELYQNSSSQLCQCKAT